MSEFQEVQGELFTGNPFTLIGKNWMLITAEKENQVNTMTAAWGGLGVMWGKNVAFVVIRPQRYTREFVDSAAGFSLSFFNESFKPTLSYLGAKSGREEDKIQKAGLTVLHDSGIPYFAEAETALLCQKLYVQAYEADCFLAQDLNEKWYPGQDHHILYIAEILKILVKS